MSFRFYYQELGGHTHVRVFAGLWMSGTGKVGDLCFRNEEWKVFRDTLEASQQKDQFIFLMDT